MTGSWDRAPAAVGHGTMDAAASSLYVFVGMGATGLIDMRASFDRRVLTMAAGLLLAASVELASADAAEAPSLPQSQGAGDGNAYQRGMHLFHAEQYEDALPFFVRAKDEARSRAGPGSAEHATALNNLGELYRRMERFDEAEPLFREAIAIDEARLGPDHHSLAKPLNNLALVQRAQGDFVEAERNQKRSLRILEDTVGRRHPDVAGSLNNLARLYEATAFPERAQPLLERALMIAQSTLGEAHPTTKQIAVNLDRVNETLSAAADGTRMAGVDREAAALPPPTALRLPPPADLPEPTASVAAHESPDAAGPPVMLEPPATVAPETISPADLVAGLEPTLPASTPSMAALPASAAPVIAEPEGPALTDQMPADEAPALAANEAAAEVGAAADEVELAAAAGALNGAANGAAEAMILPQVRPSGLRWSRLPPGGYAMHLASVRSPVSATEEWERLADVLGLPDVVHQLEPQRIEQAERGIFYRVLGGPFSTSEEAAAACAPVRAKGEYCDVLANGD